MFTLNTADARNLRALGLGALLLGAIAVVGCANKAGDDVECPTCNNTTELLVGARCVAIAEVATCGPDGHAHGSACHCFSGQEPTSINGTDYCLQQSCGEAEQDTDSLACDEVNRVAETVTAVTALADVDDAHIGVGSVAEVTLPANQESFVHFGADEAGGFLVYAATAGILDVALTESGVTLDTAVEGSNEDCATTLPEVSSVHAQNVGPVVLRFKAGTNASVKLVIYESAHAH